VIRDDVEMRLINGRNLDFDEQTRGGIQDVLYFLDDLPPLVPFGEPAGPR
jgi:hypothetical protein